MLGVILIAQWTKTCREKINRREKIRIRGGEGETVGASNDFT